MPPNSGAVVWAASTAPAGPQAGQRRVVVVGDRSLKIDGGLACTASPRTVLELLHAEGHAAEGQRDVGRRGRLPGPLEVGEAEGVERRRLDGGDAGLERLERGQLPGPERIDQAAGITQPRRAHDADSTPRPLAAPPGRGR